MNALSYRGYRFPPAIIQHAIWLYMRFTLSFRDVEDILAERGILVSHETIRRWVSCGRTRGRYPFQSSLTAIALMMLPCVTLVFPAFIGGASG
jgi:hypothetical protein